MYNVEKHIVKKGSELFKQCDELCFLSKNLYNATLYAIRQYYFEHNEYLGYKDVCKRFVEEHNPDYYALPTKVSQKVIQLVDNNFKSFFSLVKKKSATAKIPKYLHKTKGRQELHYNNQAFSFNCKNVPKGYIKLSGTNILIKTRAEKPTYVKITRLNSTAYVILIGYEVREAEPVINSNYAAIDLGINNLATVTFTNAKPIIINGKPLKSINQYYNKTLANLQSKQDSYIESVKQVDENKAKSIHKRTNLMNRITTNRNNKVDDYMHKAAHLVMNHLVSNNISKLIIGYNKGWKQDVNLGDSNNQNFVQIPFLKFVTLLENMCMLRGIEVVRQEESYTSKASFIDKDYIATYAIDDNLNNPSGYRQHRGLYITKNKLKINADVNGSLNIMRKYLKVAENIDIYNIIDFVEACSTPTVFTVK